MGAVILLSAPVLIYACRAIRASVYRDNIDKIEFRYELENRAVRQFIRAKHG